MMITEQMKDSSGSLRRYDAIYTKYYSHSVFSRRIRPGRRNDLSIRSPAGTGFSGSVL
jgi:hypothetical protein